MSVARDEVALVPPIQRHYATFEREGCSESTQAGDPETILLRINGLHGRHFVHATYGPQRLKRARYCCLLTIKHHHCQL